MQQLLPRVVSVHEHHGHHQWYPLLGTEQRAVAGAVDHRRREYATGRHCARSALAGVGLPGRVVLQGEHREPLWPGGVVGSITHCRNYAAAAVARKWAGIVALGIDAEPHTALGAHVVSAVVRPDERAGLVEARAARPDIHWEHVIFSAKEALFKAWWPMTGRRLDFSDAGVTIDPATRNFTAEVHEAYAAGRDQPPPPTRTVVGRWSVDDGLIRTAVVVHVEDHESRPAGHRDHGRYGPAVP